MVDFVDVFVDPAVMQQAMEEVVPGILNNGTAKALSKHVRPGGEDRERWAIIRKALVLRQMAACVAKVISRQNSYLIQLKISF